MGTAFTKEQAMGLMRLAKTINLCYDGDDAGQNANYKWTNYARFSVGGLSNLSHWFAYHFVTTLMILREP